MQEVYKNKCLYTENVGIFKYNNYTKEIHRFLFLPKTEQKHRPASLCFYLILKTYLFIPFLCVT